MLLVDFRRNARFAALSRMPIIVCGLVRIAVSIAIISWMEARVAFSANAELPVNQFNFTSSYYSPRGFMMMGTFDGLLTFYPQKIVDKAIHYQIHFKQLYINNKLMSVASEDSPLKTRLDCTDEIVLSYDQAKSFSIEYGVVMPGCMENVRYQIKVDGIDKDWRDVGTEHRFNGYLLQPGNYRLSM